MHLGVIPVLCLLLVPFSVRAGPSVDMRPSLLKLVRTSAHHDDTGEGLKLTFEPLEPEPALALFARKDAREVVMAVEGLATRTP